MSRPAKQPQVLLGGLSAAKFLHSYWQKRPLLIRQAMPNFDGVVAKHELLALAGNAHCHARLVWRQRSRWQVEYGPFKARAFSALRGKPWTVLVQDMNYVVPAAQALLQRFDFIPYARLDDVMVSYATPGGGVGPHVDSYDVFLLQGAGQRRWQVATGGSHALRQDQPLKLLREFEPEHDWVLQPGDMLYLPPGVAHCGTAVSECMTYSIGFRAPSRLELVSRFLDYLQEHLDLEGMYHDPDLRPSSHPGRIDVAMMRRCQTILSRVKWHVSDSRTLIGRYLSEAKAGTVFQQPPRALAAGPFASAARRLGVRLDARTRLLTHGAQLFINGQDYKLDAALRAQIQRLADARRIAPPQAARLSKDVLELLHAWYRAGYLRVGVHVAQT